MKRNDTLNSQMLNVISNNTVEPRGTRVTGSKDIVSRHSVTSVHTSAAWTVEFILNQRKAKMGTAGKTRGTKPKGVVGGVWVKRGHS